MLNWGRSVTGLLAHACAFHLFSSHTRSFVCSRPRCTDALHAFETQLSWRDTGTSLDASAVKQPSLWSPRGITGNSEERESSKPCLEMLPSVRVRPGAEPNRKKVRRADYTNGLVLLAMSTSHILPTSFTHGGSSSSSAPPQAIAIVVHKRPDDSCEHTGSKKLKLSDPGNLPSKTPMSSDVNLSSDDMRIECLLERFERERVANKSSNPVLNRIAGWVSDEQFLEVAGLDGPARGRVAYDLLNLEQSLNDIPIAETFSQFKTMATPGLIFDMSRSC